jgi:hypothetical protein
VIIPKVAVFGFIGVDYTENTVIIYIYVLITLIEDVLMIGTWEQVERLIRVACNFQGMSLQAREICREKYRTEENESENILRMFIDGQIGSFAEKMINKVELTSIEISYQIGVITSFIRTHFLVSDFILNGDLLEAIVLIRKQLESLARLHELDSTPWQQLTGKVPNIKNILKGSSGRMYGNLSEVAHFSTPRVAHLLHIIEDGELLGPSLLPQYSKESGACFDMNCFVAIYFIAWLVEKLPSWYSSYDNTGDKLILGKTVLLAVELGVIHVMDKPTSV